MGCCLWKPTRALRSRGRPSPNTFNTPPLQLPLLPLTFSGLEEKTNSTEAWKGKRSSVEVVEVRSHAPLVSLPYPPASDSPTQASSSWSLGKVSRGPWMVHVWN